MPLGTQNTRRLKALIISAVLFVPKPRVPSQSRLDASLCAVPALLLVAGNDPLACRKRVDVLALINKAPPLVTCIFLVSMCLHVFILRVYFACLFLQRHSHRTRAPPVVHVAERLPYGLPFSDEYAQFNAECFSGDEHYPAVAHVAEQLPLAPDDIACTPHSILVCLRILPESIGLVRVASNQLKQHLGCSSSHISTIRTASLICS
jgi:hypothetical protein